MHVYSFRCVWVWPMSIHTEMSIHIEITAWIYMALLESIMKVSMAVKFLKNSSKINRNTSFWYSQLNALS